MARLSVKSNLSSQQRQAEINPQQRECQSVNRVQHHRKSAVCCHDQRGLTLIEVLIALAIIAIAMTAIIKAASENIRSTSYLQHKTLALWIAEDVINQARVGVITIADDDTSENSITILGEDWRWRGHSEMTANAQIKKISVDVYSSDDEASSPIMSLESFIYAQ